MTLRERVLAELERAGGPLTAAELARVCAPHIPHQQAHSAVSRELRTLAAARRVRSRVLPRRGRGRRPLAWEIGAPDPATSAGRAGCDPGTDEAGAGADARALALAARCVRVEVPAHVLHPSTAPEAIRASHRREVAEYLTAHPGASAAEVGAALVLPASIVQRHAFELKGVQDAA